MQTVFSHENFNELKQNAFIGCRVSSGDWAAVRQLSHDSLLSVFLFEIRPRWDRIRWSDNTQSETNKQHARIYSALATGNVEQAQSGMRDHIRAGYNSLLDECDRYPQ
jgi:DNA-binding GntR family transcriptional regulator